MDEDPKRDDARSTAGFAGRIDRQARRRRRRRLESDGSVWQWLGMFGLVGWAVAIPTLVGIAVGWWIDSKWESPASWTLNLLVVGVLIGCWNAWRWVEREGRGTESDDPD